MYDLRRKHYNGQNWVTQVWELTGKLVFKICSFQKSYSLPFEHKFFCVIGEKQNRFGQFLRAKWGGEADATELRCVNATNKEERRGSVRDGQEGEDGKRKKNFLFKNHKPLVNGAIKKKIFYRASSTLDTLSSCSRTKTIRSRSKLVYWTLQKISPL